MCRISSLTLLSFLYKRQGMIRAFAYSRFQYHSIQRFCGRCVHCLPLLLMHQRFSYSLGHELIDPFLAGDPGEIGEMKPKTPPPTKPRSLTSRLFRPNSTPECHSISPIVLYVLANTTCTMLYRSLSQQQSHQGRFRSLPRLTDA